MGIILITVSGGFIEGRGGGRVSKRMFLNTHYYCSLGYCSSLL